MPITKCVKSLKQYCLENVTSNMDDWCKDYVETYGKDNKFYMYVIGPFDPLPSKLLVDIINILKEQKKLKRHYLELLIIQQLSTLDLSRECDEVASYLRLASVRCSQLKILRLSGCQKISKQVYQNFLPLFDKLQVLDISNTTAGDSCLYILGAYCKDLRELDVTSCPVTDTGVQGLCLSVDDMGHVNERLGQCKAINKLKIGYTKVTKTGIRTALENLRYLKVLECCSSVQVLAEMHLTAFENKIPGIPKYSLIDLHCTEESLGSPYSRGSLSCAVSLCSSVIRVRIVTMEGLSDDDLLPLMALERLRDLSIGAGEVCEITFDGSIGPVLQAIGSGLESLTLAELPCINIRCITEFCPTLRFLSLVMNHTYSMAWTEMKRISFNAKTTTKSDPSVLKQLDSLHLVCVSHLWASSVIPSESFPSLLSSPSLEHIYVKDCHTLTDDILNKAAKLHNFMNLKHLELEQCNSVTVEGIHGFMNGNNPLKRIKLWDCRLITRQNVETWKKKVIKKRWTTSIEWR